MTIHQPVQRESRPRRARSRWPLAVATTLLVLILPLAAQAADEAPPPITRSEASAAMVEALRAAGRAPYAGLKVEDYLVHRAADGASRSVGLWLDADGNIIPNGAAREAAVEQCEARSRYVRSGAKFLNFKLVRNPEMHVRRDAGGNITGSDVEFNHRAFAQYGVNSADGLFHIREQREGLAVSESSDALGAAVAKAWGKLKKAQIGGMVGACGPDKPAIAGPSLHFSSRIQQTVNGDVIAATFESAVPLDIAGPKGQGSAPLRNVEATNSIIAKSEMNCTLEPRHGTLEVEATFPRRKVGSTEGIEVMLKIPPVHGGEPDAGSMPGVAIDCPQAKGLSGFAARFSPAAAILKVMKVSGAPWWLWFVTLHSETEGQPDGSFRVTGWTTSSDPDVIARKVYRESRPMDESTLEEETVLEIRRAPGT